MSIETETSAATIALADAYCAKADTLRERRQEMPHGPKRQEVFNIEREYLRQADRLYSLSIVIMGQEADKAITAINSASKRILEFVQLVKDIERLIIVSAAILGIGVAVQSGSAPAIFAAIKAFVEAVNSSDKQITKLGVQTIAALGQLEKENEKQLSLLGL